MLDRVDGFIAYQDEEHGLGHKAAQSLAMQSVGGLQPTRRHDTNATLGTVAGNRAQKAVVPLQRDGTGYDVTTLEGLIDYNQTLRVTGDVMEEDNYCLAVPSVLVHEIAQSAHPGSFGENGAINLAAVNKRADAASFRFSLKKRLETVYVNDGSLHRCGPAIEALRADGVDVIKIGDGHDAYREVLKAARGMLDPERVVKTELKDSEHKRISEIKGANHAKALIGVLLPLEVVYGGTRNIVEIRGDGRKVMQNPDQYFDGDYYPVVENLAAEKSLEGRFVIVERRPQRPIVRKGEGINYAKLLAPLKPHKLIGKIDRLFSSPQGARLNPFPFVRMLLKFDTQGAYVGNIDTITKVFKRAGIPFIPVYLHKDKEKLPVVLEIEIAQGTAYKRAFETVLRLATKKSRNHNFMILGTYGSDESMLDHGVTSAMSGRDIDRPAWVTAVLFIAALSSLFFLYLLIARLSS